MPTSVIHEIVGKKIADKNKYLDNYNYYLGLITPDAVNYKEFAPKEQRWYAHLRDKDLDKWKKNVIDFYYDNKDKYDLNFFRGYICHIITDIVFDDLFYMSVTTQLSKLNLYKHDAHLYMLKEMDSYMDDLNYLYTMNKLKENDELFEIRNIDKDILSKWKYKIINQQVEMINKEFLTPSIINDLAIEVEKELKLYKVI